MVFAKEFDPFRGDVLYGVTGSRTTYIESWMDFQKRTSTNDQYRNFSINANRYFYINDFNEPISRGNFDAPANIQLDQHQDRTQVSYLDQIFETRYNPYDVGQVPQQRLVAKNNFTLQGAPNAQESADMLMVQAIRRACKFGIEYVAKSATDCPTGVLHYILDGIVLHDVVNKSVMPLWTGTQGIPITTSEIRFIFRHWSRYRNSKRFIFWNGFRDVKAPWEATPSDWIPYAQSRVNKYRQQLVNTRPAQVFGFDRAILKNEHRLAINIFHDMAVGDIFAD